MKIGMIVNSLDVSGGYQKLVLRLTEELSSFGHEVFLYTLRVDKGKCYPEIINKMEIVSLSRKRKDKSILGCFKHQLHQLINLLDLVHKFLVANY